MSNYNILFSLGKNWYLEGAPVVLETGALVTNTETGGLHIQLKCKNLESSPIVMLKAEFLLMDSIGREVKRTEYQYIDLNAKLNESFCDRVPVYVNNDSVRKFSARIVEVCFNDGTVWTSPENAVWEQIPSGKPLSSKLPSKEARDEFARVYCQKAQVVPFTYKDLWICSCQNANKNSTEQCSACRAVFSKMTDVDNETLKKDNIYHNASALMIKANSAEVTKGIALFESIIDWKDSARKVERAKQNLENVKKQEAQLQIKAQREAQLKAKRKKKAIIIGAISCAVLAVLIIGISVGISISKANKYKKAQEYIAQGNNYSETLSLLEDLEGYKNADELYYYMQNESWSEIIRICNFTEFTIPEGVTSIVEMAFFNCDGLTSVVIPSSVTSIGFSAFAFCDRLTSVYYKGTVSEWRNISIGYSNYDLTDATRYYYSESKPAFNNGYYWHYVDGVATPW